jgi:hypothetical protein
MKLTKIVHLAVKGMDKEAKQRLADALNISLNSLYRLINENQSNGDLTKAKAIEIISQETGISKDQILEDERLVEDKAINA